ncbi:hypothetical protein O0L34_g7743 [Tuta absoluta]|nr:hypothetical protein O0L34_g7743 [Tuta absoluta]
MQAKTIVFVALIALAVLPVEMSVTYDEWMEACSSEEASADWIKECSGKGDQERCRRAKKMWIKACPDAETAEGNGPTTEELSRAYNEWMNVCSSKRASANWIKSCSGEPNQQRCVTTRRMWIKACPDREAKP